MKEENGKMRIDSRRCGEDADWAPDDEKAYRRLGNDAARPQLDLKRERRVELLTVSAMSEGGRELVVRGVRSPVERKRGQRLA